jgi:hypothetical protein
LDYVNEKVKKGHIEKNELIYKKNYTYIINEMKSKLISLSKFRSLYGDFHYENVIECTRNDNYERWTRYYLELTVAMNKYLQDKYKDSENEKKLCFVDHWKKNTYGWCVIEHIYELPYRINDLSYHNLDKPLSNGMKNICILECESNSKNSDDDFNTEICVYYFDM